MSLCFCSLLNMYSHGWIMRLWAPGHRHVKPSPTPTLLTQKQDPQIKINSLWLFCVCFYLFSNFLMISLTFKQLYVDYINSHCTKQACTHCSFMQAVTIQWLLCVLPHWVLVGTTLHKVGDHCQFAQLFAVYFGGYHFLTVSTVVVYCPSAHPSDCHIYPVCWQDIHTQEQQKCRDFSIGMSV